jgi:hypothetical protein
VFYAHRGRHAQPHEGSPRADGQAAARRGAADRSVKIERREIERIRKALVEAKLLNAASAKAA